MKKILMVLILMICLCGCGSKGTVKSTKETVAEKTAETTVETEKTETGVLLDIPAEMMDDMFVEGDYDIYGKADANESLAGDMLRISGQFKEVEVLNTDEADLLFTIFTDDGGNNWLLVLDEEKYRDAEDFDEYREHELAVAAFYAGYAGQYEMPLLMCIGIFDRELGSSIDSIYCAELFKEAAESGSAEEEPAKEETVDNNSIRPDVKEAIDSYEEFIDEYCEFMKKIDSNSFFSDVSALSNYYNMLEKLTEMEGKIDALEDDLNDAELLYYSEVMLRCSQKMIQAAQ